MIDETAAVECCPTAGSFRLNERQGRWYTDARLQYFARLWFESDGCNAGSFRWVCEELGFTTRDFGAGYLR